MTILRKDFDPAQLAQVVPGQPGYPGSPAYCIDVPVTTATYKTIFTTVPPDPHIPGSGGTVAVVVTTGSTTTIEHECFAAIAPTPGTAPTVIPAVEANYYVGWNAAADSIPTLAGDGVLTLTASASAVGIVAGITPTPVEPGYQSITHGIYFASGQYQYIENGVPLTPAAPFSSTDVFTIRRLGRQVAYYKGTTLDYTSTSPSDGTVYANASLYFGGDEVLDAAFDTTIPAAEAGLGGRGTFDPPLPSSPPATPTGGVPLYTSVAGTLPRLQGFASNQSGGGVNSSPPDGTSDPGAGPGTTGGTDSNGDWPGRTGGELRSLVGVAISYNTGSVAGTLAGLTPSVFGSDGDGTHYSITAGALAGLSGSAGAGLLTPNFSVVNGYLGGVGGFAIALAGMLGVAQGKLTQLRGFASNQNGATVDSGGGGGSGAGDGSGDTTGSGGGSGGPNSTGNGDYVGRQGGELRGLVGEAYSLPTTTYLFDDQFTGSGGMAAHLPVAGGPYSDTTGSIGSYVLDGNGGLPSALPGAGTLVSTLLAPADGNYILSGSFTDTAGSDTLDLTLGVGTSTTGNDIITAELTYDGAGNWTLTLTVSDADGTVLYTASTPVAIAGTGAHTITVSETSGGVTARIDGTVVLQTTRAPDVAPDTVSISNITSGSTSKLTLDGVTLALLPAEVGYVVASLKSSYNLFSFGHSQTIFDSHGNPTGYGLQAVLSGYALDARGGAQASGSLPTPSLSASGTAQLLARASGTLPAFTLQASGTTTLLARATPSLRTKYAVSARGGAVAHAVLSTSYVVDSSGIVTQVARAVGKLPRPTLTASATAGLVARAVGSLPALRAVPSGTVIATIGHYRLDAHARTTVEVDYEAYAFTLIEGTDNQLHVAATHYTTFPFDRIVRFGSKHYGVAADGLYELTGDTFDGAPIVATVQTAETDFGKPQLKRAASLFLGGRVAADMEISVISSELDENDYTYQAQPKDGALNHRVRFGKGIRARYFAFKLSNTEGENFAIDDMTAEIADTRRSLV